MRRMRLAAAGCALGVIGGASGQWISFVNETSNRLVANSAVGAEDTEEKDYAWGDVDNDGDTDLVVVRKKPQTFVGGRTHVLLLNEGPADGQAATGVLVDRTAQYASTALDVPGDQGFLTPTSNRDVALVDVNGDGWLDIVTAATLGNGLPKHISHPRIYMNLGLSGAGDWQGFRFENFRIPSFSPNVPRFNGVAPGDFDEDGDVDLYFSDSDASGASNDAPPDQDTNNRLLINDGTGVFSDGNSLTYFANLSLQTTGFGANAHLVDLNGDNNLDILRVNTLTPVQRVEALYNNIGQIQGGFFQNLVTVSSNAPTYVNVGDLNNDQRLDVTVHGDNVDQYLVNTSINPNGTMAWTSINLPSQTTSFAGQSVIADLDSDGWNDILISDVSFDIPGCTRTSDILRNGGASVTNETQRFTYASNQLGALTEFGMTGVFDFAVFDIGGDGCLDIVVGRCTGTQVWIQASPGCDDAGQPTGDPCGDIDGNGIVNDADLGILLGFYGDACTNGPACASDINDDNIVDDADLGLLLAQFGGGC